MNEDTDKVASAELEKERLELDRERIAVDKSRCNVEESRMLMDAANNQNSAIDKLLEVVRYLNSVQFDSVIEIEESFQRITQTVRGRELTADEKQLRNVAMSGMKVLAARIGGIAARVE